MGRLQCTAERQRRSRFAQQSQDLPCDSSPVHVALLGIQESQVEACGTGSSGGTGGVVSARGAPGGFCSDTAGSCRIPGAHTGTVGFRPSLGCYNAAGGIVPQTTSRDTVGTTPQAVNCFSHICSQERVDICDCCSYLSISANASV